MLRDVLRETWTNSDIVQEGREEGLQPGFQQAFLQGLQQAHREVLQEFRQTPLKIVRVRFPKAVRLAKKQTADIEDSAILRDLIVKLSVAQTAEEAVIHLLEVDEEEEDED
jgi:flagellar biosynthesis/type III secretory pathway protein FliH